MKVERVKNEIIVRLSVNRRTSNLQDMLDYLRYEELASRSSAKQGDIDRLISKVKKGRWQRIKSELGIDGKNSR